MKFIKDLSRYNISTKNGLNVRVLDENFEYSISEYILCKVSSKSVIGYDLLILYSSIGDPIHCFNKTFDTADEISKYSIVFTEIDNLWYNVRIGPTGHLESSKGYSSYKEAQDNRLPSENYTICINECESNPSLSDLLNDEDISGKCSISDTTLGRERLAHNYENKSVMVRNSRVIDSVGSDITEEVNNYIKLSVYLCKRDIDLILLMNYVYNLVSKDKVISKCTDSHDGLLEKYYKGDLDFINYFNKDTYIDVLYSLYCDFIDTYPELSEYLGRDFSELKMKYTLLRYGSML